MSDFDSAATDALDAATVPPDRLTAATIPPLQAEPIEPGDDKGCLRPGSVIGDYRIIKELARGGMGVVYIAQHLTMGRQVAIKTLLIGADRSSSEVQRFAVEAEAAAKLDHAGIVSIYEVGEHNGEPYLVMRLIDGDNLAKRLQDGPLPVDIVTRIAIEVADAISHAHQRGVIHRDLKPANILLDRQENQRAIVTDFGVAKCIESIRGGLTTAGEPIGTPHYMPPEQADASRGEIGPAADIYSIGALIYAMLTGRPPFQAASSIDVILQVLSSEPVPPRRLNATVPATLEAIVLKCLQKEPTRRYKTAADLSLDLQRFRDGKPTVARPLRGWRWAGYQFRRHFLVATVSGSGVMLLLIASLVVAFAYAKAVSELVDLRQQNLDMSEVLANERDVFRKEVSRLQRRDVSQAEFDSETLPTTTDKR
jgi:serine/threonine protein kinase